MGGRGGFQCAGGGGAKTAGDPRAVYAATVPGPPDDNSLHGRMLVPAARSQFVQSEGLWLRYRRSSCLTEASRYRGGSFQPVAFASCEVSRNQSHLKDLAELRHTLRFH